LTATCRIWQVCVSNHRQLWESAVRYEAVRRGRRLLPPRRFLLQYPSLEYALNQYRLDSEVEFALTFGFAISRADFADLCARLVSRRRLQYLQLIKGSLEEDQIALLAASLKAHGKFATLIISNCRASNVDVLVGVPSLTELAITESEIKEDTMARMCDALALNRTLRKLDLSKTNLSDAACARLADMLEKNPTVQVLWLRNNAITDAGIRAFNTLIMQSKSNLLALGYVEVWWWRGAG
jgi:hypothetical protein